jgi:hypothetical protein
MTGESLLREAESLGIRVVLTNGNLEAIGPSSLPKEQARPLLNRLKEHKAELLAILRQRSGVKPNVRTECYACKGKLFWRSVYGVVICWRCHAPGTERLVTDILWDGEVKWHQ